MTDWFGLTQNLQYAKLLAEPILGTFADHESSYFSGHYYLNKTDSIAIIRKNYDSKHNEWVFEEHKDIQTLIMVYVKDNKEQLDKIYDSLKASGCILLQREFMQDGKMKVVKE